MSIPEIAIVGCTIAILVFMIVVVARAARNARTDDDALPRRHFGQVKQ